MKKQLIDPISLIAAILFVGNLVFAGSFEDFMNGLNKAPGVITAHRESATLWVKIPGSADYMARGQELAEMIADWYKAKVGGVICVRVYYGDRHTIGKSCRY